MAEDWNGTRINTWRKIAAYLGVEVEVVQEWTSDRALPIFSWLTGDAGRVFAYAADLDRWRREELVGRPGNDGPRYGESKELSGSVSVADGDGVDEVDEGSLAVGDGSGELGAASGTAVGAGEGMAQAAIAHKAVAAHTADEGVSAGVPLGMGKKSFLAGSGAVFVAVLTAVLLHSVGSMPREGDARARWDAMLASSALDTADIEPTRLVSGGGSTTVMGAAKTAAPDRERIGDPAGRGDAVGAGGGVAVVDAPAAGVAGGDAKVRHQPSRAALDLYLDGRYLWSLRTVESLEQAKLRFTEAIRLDPQYGQAYAGLADCYLLLRQYGPLSSESAFPKAAVAARRAVELDGGSAEGHRSLGFVLSYWDWDMRAAEREFQRAIAINPRDAEAHHWYATSLMNRGRFAEALTQIDLARSIEPTSRAILANRGLILLLSGDHEGGSAALRELEATDPGFLMPHLYLADDDLRRGEDRAFLVEEEAIARLCGDRTLRAQMAVARFSLRQGGHAAMVRTLAKTAAVRANLGGSAYQAAFYGILAQDRGAALRYLKISHDRHEPMFLSVDDEPDFAQLDTDPEFRALRAMADRHT